MASVQVQTTTLPTGVTGGPTKIAKTGSRLWVAIGGGADATNPGTCLWYSDNDGAAWTKHAQIHSNANRNAAIVTYQDSSSVWHLHAIVASSNTTAGGDLVHRAVHSNVASGTPGAMTSAITIESGGTNLGINQATIFVTNTATNPRLWVVARKQTTSTAYQTKAWYCAIGTAADTAGNWTAMVNAGGNSGTSSAKFGAGAAWTVSGSPKATVICMDGQASPHQYKAFTFDPTAATPAFGTATTFGALFSGSFTAEAEQPLFSVAARADYLVFGRNNPQSSNDWTFYKTTAGTSWSVPTGWAALTMGRAALASDGTDFWVTNSSTYGAIATTAQALEARKITTATDSMGSAAAFSDTNGNPTSAVVADSNLYAVYRAGTSSPFSARFDYVSVSTGSQLTANPSDTLSLADDVDSLLGSEITVSSLGDALPLSDATSQSTGALTAAPSDALGLADSPVTSIGANRSPSDALSLSDFAQTAKGGQLSIGEAANLADSASSAVGLSAAPVDAASLADAITAAEGSGVTVPDTLGVGDSSAASSGFAVVVPDAAGASDSAQTAAGVQRAVPEALALADSTAFYRAVTSSDALGVGDSSQAVAGGQLTLSEALALADLAALSRGVVAPDSLSAADDQDVLLSYDLSVPGLSDAAGVSDSTVHAFGPSALLSDSLSLGDQRAFGFGLGHADAPAVSDSLSWVFNRFSTVSDNTTSSDALVMARNLVVVSAISVSDLLGVVVGKAITVADAASLAEALSLQKGAGQTLSDFAALADGHFFFAVKSASDSLSLADTASSVSGRLLLPADAIGASDAQSFSSFLQPATLTDAALLSDSVSFLGAYIHHTLPLSGTYASAGSGNVLSTSMSGAFDSASSGVVLVVLRSGVVTTIDASGAVTQVDRLIGAL